MKRMDIRLIIMMLVFSIAAAPIAARQSESGPMKKEIVKVNYINVREAYQILQPYMSPHGTIRVLVERNTLVIEDQPAFVGKVLGILKEIDTPPLDLRFTVDILEATMGKGESDRRLEADPVIRELKKLVKFESFRLLDTALIKVQDNSRTTQRLGGEGVSLELSLAPRHIEKGEGDAFHVELRLLHHYGFDSEGKVRSSTLINTTLSIESGERQVVGVSKLNGGEKSLILILRGEVMK